jgi:hypothetical protein
MPILPGNPNPDPTTTGTVLDLVSNALIEMGALAQGEAAAAGDAQFCLNKLNRLIDVWEARRVYVYNVQFTLWTLTPNLNPHTIGPGGTFVVSQRPVKLEGANLVLNTAPQAIDIPLNVRGDHWWSNQRIKSLASSIPTDVFYSADWPNGTLNFWPVPKIAYQVRLETWGLTGQFIALTDPVNLPPAYLEALTLSLAEMICPSFGKALDPVLAASARAARLAIQGNNMASPRMESDAPSEGGGWFNYRSGSNQ